jgi:hypothetical protein
MTTAASSLGFILALASTTPATAAAPQLAGQIQGVELLPQSIGGSAIFAFSFTGTVNGKSQRGLGYIEVNHGELPPPGGFATVTRGSGTLWIGLRKYRITSVAGALQGVTPDLFSPALTVEIADRTQSAPHTFLGGLSHEVFPPGITGNLSPEVN